MTILKKQEIIAAKTETTIGTAIALATGDTAFNAYDIKTEGNIEVLMRENPGSFGKRKGTPGSRAGKMTFKTDLAWLGTGLPAWASTLLPACGYVASSQVFTPRSETPGANVKTITIGTYDTRKRFLAGAVGNFKIVCPAGKLAFIEWEFMGVWQPVIDTAILAGSHPDDVAARFAGAQLTYNSVNQCVENLTFDAGNKIIMRECPDDIAGFKSGIIVDREPKITINPESQLVADDDRYGFWIGGDEYALSAALTGKSGVVSDATFTLAAPKAQVVSIGDGDRDGLSVDEVELSCNKNGTTNDEDVSLTFTDLADS